MLEKLRLFLNKHKFTVLILIWVFLYFAPWALWLGKLPWISLGITIVLFAVPGIAMSLYLAGKRLTLLSHFISGFSLSICLVGLFGLLGRIFHLPFEFIRPAFFLTGLVLFFVLKRYSDASYQWYKPKKFSIVVFVLLALMFFLGTTLSFLYRFTSDDFSYLAYITNWQHAQMLNFREVIFNTGDVDSIRFWLAMFPMNLAFLSELSNLHGVLLLGFYLEPFFIALAILAAYTFYDDLFQSDHLAISAVLVQFMFLLFRNGVIYTGIIFFNRLSHDKTFAAFVLAPIFFLAIRYFIESYNLRSGVFLFFIGLSLALTHPVILAFSVFIAGLYGAIVILAKTEFKKLGLLLTLLAIIVFFDASTRIIQLPVLTKYIPALDSVKPKGNFDLESALTTKDIDTRISYIDGTPFYGFNLNIIKISPNITSDENLLQWSYLWMLGLGFLWSLFNLKKNSIAPFIAASSFLVLLAAIPYTGWLIGYFVSARLLIRASWMMHFGLIGTVLLYECFKYISLKMPDHVQTKIPVERIVSVFIITITIILITCVYTLHVYRGGWRSLATFNEYRVSLQNYASLGSYLEKNIPTASIFVAPTQLRDYLPGLSSKSKVAFFRGNQFLLYPVDMRKINLVLSPNASVSIGDIVNTLTEYHINYILTKNGSLKNYYLGFPKLFQAKGFGSFWIIEFRKSSP